MALLRLGTMVASLLLGSTAFAQNAAPPAPIVPPTVIPAADAPAGGGPYKAILEMDQTLPGMTIYGPADPAKLATAKLPIVVWANGACANAGNAFRAFLTEIASYGYFIIALGPIDPRLNQPRPPAPPPGTVPAGPRVLPPPATHSRQLIEAMDWVTGPAAQAGKYRGRLDVKRIAVMGQSCGGVQTIEASADPRVTTAVIWNSGMPAAGTDMAGGRPLTKDDILKMHAPTAYISGDESDIAFTNANDDYERLSKTKLPVFRGWERGIPHGGTYNNLNGGEFAGVAVAWLNWQLKGDANAARLFRGTNCGLCANPRWVVASSHLNGF